MVNKKVYDYLKRNSKKHRMDDLAGKLIKSGYSEKDVNEAIQLLTKQNENTSGKSPQERVSRRPKKQKVPQTRKFPSKNVKFNVPKTRQMKTQNSGTTQEVQPSNNEEGSNQSKGESKKEPKKGFRIILIVLGILVILALVGYFLFFS